MHRLLGFTMRRPFYCYGVVALLSLGAVTLWLALPLIMLITLSNGLVAGCIGVILSVLVAFTTQVWAAEPSLTQALYPVVFAALLMQLLPGVVFPGLLRTTRSYSSTFVCALLLAYGVAAVCLAFSMLPTAEVIYAYYAHALQIDTLPNSSAVPAQMLLTDLSYHVATFWLACLYLSGAIALLLAQRWHSRLYPSARRLQENFLEMRLSRGTVIVIGACTAPLLLPNCPLVLALCAWTAVMLLTLQGASICHWLLDKRGFPVLSLVFFYIALCLVPYFLVLVVTVGASDAMMNWRNRLRVLD